MAPPIGTVVAALGVDELITIPIAILLVNYMESSALAARLRDMGRNRNLAWLVLTQVAAPVLMIWGLVAESVVKAPSSAPQRFPPGFIVAVTVLLLVVLGALVARMMGA